MKSDITSNEWFSQVMDSLCILVAIASKLLRLLKSTFKAYIRQYTSDKQMNKTYHYIMLIDSTRQKNSRSIRLVSQDYHILKN